MGTNVTSSGSGFTIIHRARPSPRPTPTPIPNSAQVEVRIDPEKKPNFSNLTDDYNLLENMIRYSRFCEQYNVTVPQMAQSLARAIGIQNHGRCNVLIYDYLLAIPEYPPTQNGVKQALTGEGRWCNIICYKSQLFGVCAFPVTDNVTFYFPEFNSFTPYVQQLIFTFGNKTLRYCQEKQALAFEFKSENVPQLAQAQPIFVTATLKRKTTPMLGSPGIPNAKNIRIDTEGQHNNGQTEFIQLE